MAHTGLNGRSERGAVLLEKGRYRVRVAADPEDVDRAQALRYRAFRDASGEGRDVDRFDASARHVLVEERESGALAACFRLMDYADGADLGQSYAAQFYDLTPLSALPGPMLELGRFCVAPGRLDPDALRLAWGALAGLVEAERAHFLFGCTSFRGTEPAAFRAAFALLAARHLAPGPIRPGEKAREVHRLAEGDAEGAAGQLPPLLRSYLAMGGWVSDHAVIDRDLGTIHVFTGLEVGAVSPARARALRALAAG